MICLVALIVFAVLGIFSATYRKIAWEAFDCVFRRLTLRKCDTGLDKKLKAEITGRLLRKAPPIGRHVYKHFEVYSWILAILMIASLIYSVWGIGNYIVYGNCNGPNDKFCVFDAFASEGSSVVSTTNETCPLPGEAGHNLTIPDISGLELTWYGNENASVKVVEWGCYTCEYSRQAEPTAKKVRSRYGEDIAFAFIPFPLPNHQGSFLAAQAAACADEQGKFWALHEILMNEDISNESIVNYAQQAGLDMAVFAGCMEDEESAALVAEHVQLGKDAGIYGTPTFFINNQTIVGPKSFKVFRKAISQELYGNS